MANKGKHDGKEFGIVPTWRFGHNYADMDVQTVQLDADCAWWQEQDSGRTHATWGTTCAKQCNDVDERGEQDAGNDSG